MEVGALIVIMALRLSSIGHALRKHRRLLVVKKINELVESNPIQSDCSTALPIPSLHLEDALVEELLEQFMVFDVVCMVRTVCSRAS